MLWLKYHDGFLMTNHLNNFQAIMNQLSVMDINFDEEIQDFLLHDFLPDSWEIFKTSLSNSAPDNVISMNFVERNVLNEEIRWKSQGSSSSDILVTDTRWRNNNHGSQNTEHYRSKSGGKFKDIEHCCCGLKKHIIFLPKVKEGEHREGGK